MQHFDWLPQTGSSKDAQRHVRRQRSYKSLWETDVTSEDDEEAEGRRTQSARLLSGHMFIINGFCDVKTFKKKILSTEHPWHFLNVPVCLVADDQDVGPVGGLLGERGLQV